MQADGAMNSSSNLSALSEEEAAVPPPLPARPLVGLATFRALRHRNYRLYFFGQMASLTGSWMQTTALMWLAFQLTGESTWPALVLTAQVLPTSLLGAWGGALADRCRKRQLLLTTQSAFMTVALLLTALVYAGVVDRWQLLLLTVLSGLVQAIDLPARLAFVIDLAGREDLMNAVALNSLQFNVARLLGPALAGPLLGLLGAWPCFLANALSYLAVLGALARMDVAETIRATSRPSLRVGVAYLVRRPVLLFLVLLAGTLSLCGWPFMSLLPALAEHRLAAQAGGYSLMVSGTGLGALTAALTVATFGTVERRRRFIGTGVAVLTAALLSLSHVQSLSLAVAGCALAGFGLILFFSTSQAAIQLGAGDDNRGLIMGIWAMVLSGAVPLGSLLVGPAADRWGEAPVLAGQGLMCAAASLGLLALLRWWQRGMEQRGGENGSV
jgi:MFS family permease